MEYTETTRALVRHTLRIWSKQPPVLSMVVGLVPLVLLMSLPWIGGLVWIAVMLLGFGAIFLAAREAVAQ